MVLSMSDLPEAPAGLMTETIVDEATGAFVTFRAATEPELDALIAQWEDER